MSSIDATANVSESRDKTYNVSANDVQIMLSLVNVVSSRGGFKPSEFKIVGELFERLTELIKDVQK